MSWQIEVDAQTCVGSGMCAALAPELFSLDGAHATVVAGDVEPDEVILDTADSCPAMAIIVMAGDEVVGPRH
jgi:ferredoxin